MKNLLSSQREMVLLIVKILLCTVAVDTVNAQTTLSTETAPDVFPVFSPRLGVRYTTEGAGFDEFATFEGFVPLLQSSGSSLTFVEGRLLLATGNSMVGGNVTLGHRFLDESGRRIIGGYFSYDNRNTGNAVFQQLGAGFESLGEDWDFRANAYLPMGRTRSLLSEIFGTALFEQNFLQLQRVRQFQESLSGFDAEFGTRLLYLGAGDVRGYAGLHYYSGADIEGFLGIRRRLVARPNSNLELGLTVQNDSRFDTRVVLGVGVNFGGNPGSNKASLLARLGEPVQRQTNILVDNQTVTDAEIAINPSTGEPWRFLHVNLGASSSGGTFENPFGTVAGAIASSQPDDILYVQSGTNPGIDGFTLPDGVTLLSTAPVQQLDTLQKAGVILPLSGTGVLPQVIGTITLGNGTTVSGFSVDASGSQGISGRNINNVTISENLVTDALGEGIFLENATGTLKITNNTVRGTRRGTTIADANISNLQSSIFIRNNKGPVDLTISGNTIENNPSPTSVDGIEVSICLNFQSCTTPVAATFRILNNTIRNLGNPDNAKDNSDGIDINLGSNAQINNLTISGNTLENISDTSITLRFEGNAKANVNISDNVIRNISDRGIHIHTFDTSITQARFSGNTIDTTATEGISFENENSTNSTVTISNNRISNSAKEGIDIEGRDKSQLWVLIESNAVNNSSSEGILILNGNKDGNTSDIYAAVRFNTLTNTDFTASANNKAKLCLQLTSNTSNPGFKLRQNDASTFQVENTLLPTNTGTVKQTGNITNGAEGSCGFP